MVRNWSRIPDRSGGGRKRDRTSDLGLVRAALSQLSYPPTLAASASCTRRVTVDDTRRVPKGAGELASDVLEVTGAGAPEVVPMHPRGRRPPCGCCPCLSVTLLLRAIGAWTNSATTCRRIAAFSRTRPCARTPRSCSPTSSRMGRSATKDPCPSSSPVAANESRTATCSSFLA